MYTNAIGELVVKTRAANASEREEQPAASFGEALAKYAREDEDGIQQTKPQRQAGNEDEARNRQRKVMELRSRIAELKARIGEPGISEYLDTELSLLQMEMFWLMMKL